MFGAFPGWGGREGRSHMMQVKDDFLARQLPSVIKFLILSDGQTILFAPTHWIPLQKNTVTALIEVAIKRTDGLDPT